MAATLQRGHIIEDEGTTLTQRSVLNFTGSGVTATDAGGKTVVDVQGGAPSGAAGGVLAGSYPSPTFASDMATQAELDAKRLDQLVAPTGDVSLNSQKIIGLTTPAAPTDAANKAYVDAIASGFDVKLSVRAATTANITLSGAQTIDGVAVIATNRVLVKNQTAAETNGIYVCAAGAWSRATDADADAEVTAGLFTFVEEGTVAGDQGWALATNNPIVLGTTALSFTQVAGVGGGGAPTGAAGGDLAGSTYPNPVIANGAVTVAKLSFDPATQAELDAHVNDTTAAHAASAISFTPDGSIAATTVQLAIQEVRDEAGAGASVSDQTISTTDNTVNNVSVTKHGWTPKAPNNRSMYLNGVGGYSLPQANIANVLYVDANAPAGGDGRSPAGAFTTFAAAMAAAIPRTTVYVLSDLVEDMNITVADLHVIGVGTRVISGSGSTSIGARIIRIGFGAHRCTLENFFINGHANFKGIGLLCDVADQVKIKNIRISGTGAAATPTYYPYASPASPYTQSTGIGGIGILMHQSEHAALDEIEVYNCSIGVAQGTWSTQNKMTNFRLDGNCQHLVEGLHSGPNGSPALTTACGWNQNGIANSHVGSNTYINWQAVVGVDTTSTSPPVMDLVGDGTVNYNGDQGGSGTFINVLMSEGGNAGLSRARIGSRGNVFIDCTCPSDTVWIVDGQHNKFINVNIGGGVNLKGSFATFDDPNFTGIGFINGAGNSATFRNAVFKVTTAVPFALTGGSHRYEQCTWDVLSGTAPTRASLGPAATVTWAQGSLPITYASTMTPSVGAGTHQPIVVTNTTAFTIANPTDFLTPDTTKILCTNPITLDILNSSGGLMGAITWGSKFALAGAFTNPASTKRRTITFYYNVTSDKWVEISRAAADI